MDQTLKGPVAAIVLVLILVVIAVAIIGTIIWAILRIATDAGQLMTLPAGRAAAVLQEMAARVAGLRASL